MAMSELGFSDSDWHSFFVIGNEVLGQGDHRQLESTSWCAWTTFDSLECGEITYWSCGFPSRAEIYESYVGHGQVWTQYFHYAQLAHFIVPAQFYWQTAGGPEFRNGTKKQDIRLLSDRLSQSGISHRLTDILLEVKLY